ncbi:venom protease-like [Chrysoperla carnea]|uniref:venom protease-like n=1 Tax=Chrysoperla carnea TaxID=189513 RepID=UPI001D068D06|nr:venom protease-like [Chrysoperla carnea]
MELLKVVFVLVATLWIAEGARPTTRKCLTPDGDNGVCIPIRACPALHTYVAYKEQTIEESEEFMNASATICGSSTENPKTMIVCCGIEDLQSNVSLTTALQSTKYSLPDLKTCGRSFSDSAYSRIVGGFEVKEGQFPWMTVLGYGEIDNYYGIEWKCGGSLISQAHVLTAAHCITDDLIKVRAGLLNIWGTYENEGDVIAKLSHEGYNKKLMIHDIAILKVNWYDKPEFNAVNTPNCGFICLPTQPAMRKNQFVRYYPFVAGWGLTAWKGERSDDLMGLQVPVVANARCSKSLMSAIKTQRVIQKTHICAGYGKTEKDSCTGDSGGPLMIPQLSEDGHTQYFQIGVVSWGHQCAVKGLPGIYTRITEYIEWIQSHMNM